MEEPVFPKEFEKNGCPRTVLNRIIRTGKGIADSGDDTADCCCNFVRRGVGMMCEECSLFLTRPYNGHERDRIFLPLIEKYYSELDAYEKWLDKRRTEHKKLGPFTVENGSHI